MIRGYTHDLSLIGLCLGTGLLLPLAGMSLGTALAISLSPLLFSHLYRLLRLRYLIRRRCRLSPPFPPGLWGEIYQAIAFYQQTDRRRRKRLWRFASRFREAANSIPDGIVVLDKGHGVEWANVGARNLFNLCWPRDEGQPITKFLSHPGLPALLEGADYGRALELTAPHNQALKLSLRIAPFGDRKSQRLIVARDITPLYHLNLIRRDFVANASHELRTPLTVIAGCLEHLSFAADTPPSHRRPLELMVSQSGRMRSIVEDLMTLSRLEMDDKADKFSPTDIPTEIRAIAREAEVLSEGRHHITLNLDNGLWLVGNEVELRSALSNLVFNAIQHTGPGSQVWLSWGLVGLEPVFAVRDNGEGIAEEHIPRLTERFYRVDKGRSRLSGGTGLGLAIVHHVLNRHDARLVITSEPGQGATFACHFPPMLQASYPDLELPISPTPDDE